VVGDVGGGAMTLASAQQMGLLGEPRDSSVFSGAAPWYQSFECADGEYVTVGALEPKFYQLLLEKCDLQNDPDFAEQFSRISWPRALDTLGSLFRQKNRAEWCDLLEGTDVCFAPVLNLIEAAEHPHNVARETFVKVDDNLQPAPAPKLSRTPAVAGRVAEVGENTDDILEGLTR
jgi:alpha-methylacyl-CoA racemase